MPVISVECFLNIRQLLNGLNVMGRKEGLGSSGIWYDGNLVVLMGSRKGHHAFVPTVGKYGDEAVLFVSIGKKAS